MVTRSAYFTSLQILPKIILEAYGAVTYICQGEQPSLIMSKTRVTPIKALTLSKLELIAAYKAVQIHYSFIMTVFVWSDSQIVLHWILNQRKLKPFGASWIQKGNNLVATCSWRWCPTQCNPADLVTRSIPCRAFTQSTL